ncbi:CHASE2 domain-containing protein [Candidatus Nitrospira bockiana]
MRRLLDVPIAVGVLVGVAVFLVLLGMLRLGMLEPLELAYYDWCLRARPGGEPDPRLIVVTITEADIREQGRWPISDATLAGAIARLREDHPRVIGLDIYRDIPVPPGHERLEELLRGTPALITVMRFGHDALTRIPPPPAIEGTDHVGVNDILLDRGGIVRRGLLFLDDGHEAVPSFALQITLRYLSGDGIHPQPDPVVPEHLRLGRTTFRPFESDDGGYVNADARGYQFLLDYRTARSSFRSVTLHTVLTGGLEPGTLTDRIVLIGTTASSVPDLFQTPYSAGWGRNEPVPGVMLHAQIIDQLQRAALDGQAPAVTWPESAEVAWMLFWTVSGARLGLSGRSPWRFAALLTAGAAVPPGVSYAALLHDWWLPAVPSTLGWLVTASLVTAYLVSKEKHDRAVLMQLFSKHVSPEIADTIWQHRDEFMDGGRPRPQRMVATVLFSDLKGFTSASERMAPEALIEWLNTYMDVMSQVIIRHKGVVDDYAGDGIKANFGVPVPRTTESERQLDALNAVSCAFAMEQELLRLNRDWHELRLPVGQMRIGIHTGPVVAGSVGSADRLKYTTVGDTVNIASRLESLQREAVEGAPPRPCRILIGESTYAYVKAHVRAKPWGEMPLKGKEQCVAVFQAIGHQPDQPAEARRDSLCST